MSSKDMDMALDDVIKQRRQKDTSDDQRDRKDRNQKDQKDRKDWRDRDSRERSSRDRSSRDRGSRDRSNRDHDRWPSSSSGGRSGRKGGGRFQSSTSSSGYNRNRRRQGGGSRHGRPNPIYGTDNDEEMRDVKQSTKVFVGNIPYDTTKDELENFMCECGEIAHVEIFVDFQGRSRGFGIVEFDSVKDASRAIDKLHLTKIQDREIYLRFDNDPDYEPKRQLKEGDAGHTLHVMNLPYSTTWQDLKDLCGEYGKVIRTEIMEDFDGKSKGRGTVRYEKAADCKTAFEELGHIKVYGRQLHVKKWVP